MYIEQVSIIHLNFILLFVINIVIWARSKNNSDKKGQ